MDRRLDNKIAVVVGAGGIGSAASRRLASEGAHVVVADMNSAGGVPLVEEMRGQGLSVEFMPVDIASEESIASFANQLRERYALIHILYINAANTNPDILSQDTVLETLDVEIWDRTFEVNARGTMLMIKYCIPLLRAAGGGSIINTSTGQSVRGDLFRPAYGSSKAAINSLTMSVATQYGKQRIRCNAVMPGIILTPTLVRTWNADDLERFESDNLTPFHGQPEDIAAMVAYLASDDSRFVTGQVIGVDGGVISHTPRYADVVRAYTEGLPALPERG